mgnify:FL=1
MKSKLKKIVIPIFLAVICGALCGRLMFNIYEEKGSSTLNSNVIYLLLDTSYNNYDEMKASTISSNYIYYEDKGKYNVVVALTKNEDNISKIEELYNKITEMFNLNEINLDNELLITNVRHKNIIEKAIQNVKMANEALLNRMPIDIITIYIKQILDDLGEITGDCVTEDIINEIFSKFCLGK